MPAIFSKNCILMGELQVDFYCLACSNHLKSEDDVLSHIQSSKHKRRCNSVGYFEKYKEDFIRRVEGMYFCEVCNTALTTAAKVALHVTEAAHLAGRRGRAVSRAVDGVVFGDQVTVSDSAWNGLVGDACVLCNVEFDDQSAHKSERRHLVNLINSNVIVNDDKDIYRKVDDIYQCLTCNEVVSPQCLTDHLTSAEHKRSTEPQNDIINSNGNEDKSKQAEGVAGYQKTSVKDIRPPSVERNIHSKPSGTKGNDGEIASTLLPKEIEILSKRHGLSVKGDGVVYCTVCSKQLTATVTCVEAHVTSAQHKGNINKSAKDHTSKDIKKISIREYAESIQIINTMCGKYAIINGSLCVTENAMHGINRLHNKIICRFCNIDLNPDNILLHIKSTQHTNYIVNCLVITSLKNEFVRQIKADLYDCAFCKTTEADFEDMLDHLETSEHKTRKEEQEESLADFKFQLAEMESGRPNPFDLFKMYHMLNQF